MHTHKFYICFCHRAHVSLHPHPRVCTCAFVFIPKHFLFVTVPQMAADPQLDVETHGVPVVDRILHWARPGSTASTSTHRRHIQLVCQASKAFFRSQAARAVGCHSSGGPVVRFYTSDGTPMLVGRCWSRLLSCGQLLLRHAKSAKGFLCERTHYLTTDQEGTVHSSVVFMEPRDLHDKKAWSLFACMLDSSPSPRSLGWTAVCINHYVWDRACFSSLGRMSTQYHEWEG